MTSETHPRRVENSIMRLMLTSLEATLGKNGYYAVLRMAGLDPYIDALPPDNHNLDTPGENLSALYHGILSMYGEGSARGLFRRCGVVFGKAAVKRRPSAALLRPMLRVLPVQRRSRALLDAVIDEANRMRGERLHTWQDDLDHYTITFRDCLQCASLHPAEPICFTIVGVFETTLKWGTGRDFAVREVRCRARGDEACVFEIGKQPLHV